MRNHLLTRGTALLVLALLAGLLIATGQPTPAAHAGEGPVAVKGNYVPLAKPTRVLNTSLGTNTGVNFTAVGVTNVPRTGTTAVALTVTVKNTGANWGSVYFDSNCSTCGDGTPVDVSLEGGKGPMTNTLILDIEQSRATNHLNARKYSETPTTISVQVDVIGFYTTTNTGGGFVALRPTTLFNTRGDGDPMIPAGGSITRTLTGSAVPVGAAAVHLDAVVMNITAAGSLVAVPAGTDTNGYPALTFWATATNRSGLVTVKLSPDGRATFKNTSTKPIHLLVRAQGYVTNSPETGADLQRTAPGLIQKNLDATEKIELQIAGNPWDAPPIIPAKGVAGVFINLEIFAPKGSGYVKIYPSGQAANSASFINFTADGTYDRTSGAIVVPGDDGKITIEAAASGNFWLTLTTTAWFAAPTDYAPAGGNPAISVAHTSAGPCYGYLDPTAHNVRVGCATEYGDSEPIYSILSPGHRFEGPVSLVARPNGRFVVSARHAPDGEVWFWEIAHTTTAPVATGIRSFRYMKTPVVSATLPNGTPVGFAADIQGRFWAIDLNVAAPNQPTWKPLDIPLAGPQGELTAASTPDGIRLAGVTAGGDVVTGLYASATSTALGWQSLGAAGATGRVAIGLSQSDQVRLAVTHAGDNTLWSASIAAAGGTVDGWHLVNTTYDGVPVALAGNPAMAYDPVDGKSILLFRSDAVGKGSLYRVRENPADSGVFDDAVVPIALDTMGIASDVTTWDYRTDTLPYSRRWSFAYLDTAYARKGFTSYA